MLAHVPINSYIKFVFNIGTGLLSTLIPFSVRVTN